MSVAESKVIYEKIEDDVLEHGKSKISNLYIAQAKQKYGIIERERHNTPKSEGTKRSQYLVKEKYEIEIELRKKYTA